MKKPILVTGGTGFIGSAVVRKLVSIGEEVRCLDNQWRGPLSNLGDIADKIEVITGDIRDFQTVKSAASGCSAIYHLAAINGTEHFYTIPELILEVSVKGMMNVIDSCVSLAIDDLIVMSSSEVYQTPTKIPTPEEVPLIIPDVQNPRYSYGGGKIISELMALNYGRKHIKQVRIVRPHNVYGPAMGWEHVVPQFICRMFDLPKSNSQQEFTIQGTGNETRAFIYIDDMAEGFLKVAQKGKPNEIYHIGTETEVSIASLAQAIAEKMGRSIRVKPSTLSAGGTLRRCPDTKKARALGFEAKTELTSGLEKTISWYVNNQSLRTQRKAS